MISRLALVAMSLLVAFGALAATTNELSDAKIAGRNLVQQILELRPTENLTNMGVFKIRPKKAKQTEIPVTFKVVVTPTNWSSVYDAGMSWVIIIHADAKPDEYRFHAENGKEVNLSGDQTMFSFAGSDFWIADLGLEFFHWPQQKVLRKEFRNHCGCNVLESVNPNPTAGSYSRVVTWIDEESLGVVQAKAYDSQNKLLKEFYPKNFTKVNGQWQVQTLDISNRQTDSRTLLKFDLDGK